MRRHPASHTGGGRPGAGHALKEDGELVRPGGVRHQEEFPGGVRHIPRRLLWEVEEVPGDELRLREPFPHALALDSLP